ncbi:MULTISPECIES: maltose alpha-D-glucosyltransferase [Paenarthrobacter]|uniref:Maltose alpha-D-glucosyltransferase n=2 Tax=Micrococcaceae TaxID=1268 RepID=A0AAX3EIJ1_PAEUR|nr:MULTISPECIES: maltose alpha-D-glucosyltransferase [Paenarthrobacter]OEH57473.1 trehalose synthase [Arthrobacter sp. D4]OEH58748.1 trehalose synthase [Arthrobacter sp. D2]MDO5866796.1 maltose alpha-D-glucosyltransferase [Paenarthrobacter sp. SD-2]MDO5877897.1 maltose alpha-D-glucosyltransferase [Paenarthrobacter sp. SD-1]UYV93068.1 maltose alpha-D-glucosyltransferase [Paenarthrobacter ureafaciens]
MQEPKVSDDVSGMKDAAGDSTELNESSNGTSGEETVEETEVPEVSFDEQFYPARPKALRPVARRRQFFAARPSLEFDGLNKTYVDWLRNQSMLGDANTMARQLSGQASMWQNAYARPNPRAAVEKAPVWFTAYPLSFITKEKQSFLAALGDPELWEAFREIGIRGLHTGPVKLAGGISGWSQTPSVDGHFDRISMAIDPAFGTEEEFRRMCEVAADHDGTVIDDIVPGHTGKGADFRLAEMNFRDYPGIYHMVDIPEEDWHLLPDVPEGKDSVNISPEAEQALQKAGYIIGRLQRVIFYEPGVKETNWSATRPVADTTGKIRRWVYLHYFKAGQPSINWLDPTFAGMRLVVGDALHSLLDLGTGALRLDANGFLGVEKSAEEQPGWSEGHPLSEAANQLIGSMIRKVGGFSFQELNLTIDDIKAQSEAGADLSYDFITRPAYHYSLVTADTEFLRLTLRLAMEIGVDQASLVHALQNHDELTYELLHFAAGHREDVFELGGEELTGAEVAEKVQQTLRDRLTGESGPYNALFTTNGIACTTASFIMATLGIPDPEAMTPEQEAQVRDVHVLMSMYNALQPGVFALSGWDLTGIIALPRDVVGELTAQGDTRWINRGAHDLMGTRPDAAKSAAGMPRARSLYGSLPEQLKDPSSYARRLQEILRVRESSGIATSVLLDVPEVSNRALLVLVNQLGDGSLEVTVLNFSDQEIAGSIQSPHLVPGSVVHDLFSSEDVGHVDDLHSFFLELGPYQGTALVLREPEPAEEEQAE